MAGSVPLYRIERNPPSAGPGCDERHFASNERTQSGYAQTALAISTSRPFMCAQLDLILSRDERGGHSTRLCEETCMRAGFERALRSCMWR